MTTRFPSRSKYPQPFKSSERVSSTRWPPESATPAIPDCVLPSLYLTDLFTARSVLLPTYPAPGRPSIRYMLSVLDNSVSQPKPKPVNADQYVQKLIILDDTPDTDLLSKLSEACDWIDGCISKGDGGVLVHCLLGQSRSASIVIAYVMRKQNCNYATALERVRRKRSIIKPNIGFQRQLQLWEEMEYQVFEADPSCGEGDARPKEAGSGLTMRRKEPYARWKEEQSRRAESVLPAT